LFSGRRRLFSGFVDVISSKVETVLNLVPGDVGRNFLIPIAYPSKLPVE
jgi:hypothetical protein